MTSSGHRALRRVWRNRDGVAAVEFALVAPTLLLLLLGVMEVGRVMWTKSALTFAVQEASRCLAIKTCANAASAQTFAAQKVAALKIPAEAFVVSDQTCGKQVKAEITYSVALMPIFNVAPKVRAQVCRPA